MKERLGGADPDFLLDETLAVTDEKLRQALDYWNAKRGARFAPARSEIDPREAKSFLPHLQILEVLDGGRALRIRLIGTAVARLLQEDMTGQTLDDASPRQIVHRVLRAARWVVEHKKPLRTFAERTALEHKTFLSHETLHLPLSRDGATVDMIALVSNFAPAKS